jgi:hypothetical protein
MRMVEEYLNQIKYGAYQKTPFPGTAAWGRTGRWPLLDRIREHLRIRGDNFQIPGAMKGR